MQWPSDGAAIRVGDEVEERTTLLSATAKKSRSAGEMVLVEVVKELEGPRGVAIVDRRSWVFRPEVDASSAAAPKPPRQTKQGPTLIEDVATESKCECDTQLKMLTRSNSRSRRKELLLVACRPVSLLGADF